MKSIIVLETGEVFEGTLLSGDGIRTGKLIFDTRVVGYEKILTSPEYSGRIVCFTYPLIGNYGINYEDIESDEIFPSALIISEYSGIYSNFRAKCSMEDFLRNKGVSIIGGIDTQYLTTLIRERKGIRAAVAPGDLQITKILSEIKNAKNSNCLPIKGIEEKHTVLKNDKPYISVINLGVKKSELEMLKNPEFDLLFLSPCSPGIEDAIANSSGIYVTSGPENLSLIETTASVIKKFVGKIPVFGAGTGHLVTGIASGGKIADSVLNHYGINHPVADMKDDRCYITEQSHSLMLEKGSVSNSIRFVNINDETVEGQHDSSIEILSTSFLPTSSIFKEFISLVKGQ